MEAALRITEQHRGRTDTSCGLTASDLNTAPPTLESRIAELAARSAEMASERTRYKNDRERLAAETMKRPVSASAAYAIFGAAIGFLPTFSVAIAILNNSGRHDDTILWVTYFWIAAFVTGTAGGLLGRHVAKLVENARAKRTSVYLSLLPFIGLLWGGAAGAIGGVFLFIIGAFFGAMVGSVIGFVAVPAFILLHGMMRQGDRIELGHLLPITLAIAGTLSAAILGL